MKWHSPVLIPFLTLNCNFSCKYCITKFAPDRDFRFDHLAYEDWIKFFSSTQGITDIIFNGGEPTLYPNFHHIINSLRPLNLIAIGTNYSALATDVLLSITPRGDLILDGSFHPHFITHHDISHNLLDLKAAGFKVRVHALSFPGFKGRPSDWIHDFKLQGIDAFIQDYEGYWRDRFFPSFLKLRACGLKKRSRVLCSRSIYTPIAPDGNVYFCHYLMYAQRPEGVIGHISDPQLSFPDFFDCPHYGWCSPCDWPRSIKPNP